MEYLVEMDGVLKIKPEFLDQLKELKVESDKSAKKLKELTIGITNEIKEFCDETTHFGDYNFVVKGGFYSYEFDLEKFKAENTKLYLQYLKPTFSKVTQTLVSATRTKKEEK